MTLLLGCQVMTRLDIRYAFNHIRMATTEDEDLTTFAIPIGNYKSLVLPFRLCGGPATFQRYINNTLIEYLNVFYTAYIDDILIFSKSKEEHTEHIKKVLQKLQDTELQADVRKSEFNVTQTKFLSLIVSKDGISI